MLEALDLLDEPYGDQLEQGGAPNPSEAVGRAVQREAGSHAKHLQEQRMPAMLMIDAGSERPSLGKTSMPSPPTCR